MGQNSAIEWTHDTWNPWQGCRKVSPGCKYCYMYRDKNRWGQDPQAVVRSKDGTFYAPLKGKIKGPLVFTCSWSDFFIEEADPWREEALEIINATPNLIYQILTKRPERVIPWLKDARYPSINFPIRKLPENIWLGVSAENQEQFDKRVDELMEIPAAVRFVSAEPLLESIDIRIMGWDLDWVISGGESGTGKNWRPARIEWFESLRDQCASLGIPYFHKQHGGNRKTNGAWGGRELDGVIHDEMPFYLQEGGA